MIYTVVGMNGNTLVLWDGVSYVDPDMKPPVQSHLALTIGGVDDFKEGDKVVLSIRKQGANDQ